MVRKQKSYKEVENENTRGKKRYLERLIEDDEAAQRVKEFLDKPEQDEDYESHLPFKHNYKEGR